jgi:hypothetical protein
MASQQPAESQSFERKHATCWKQRRQVGCENHVEIEGEPALTMDGEISEEVVPLPRKSEPVKDATVLRKLRTDECLDVRVAKEAVLVLGGALSTRAMPVSFA